MEKSKKESAEDKMKWSKKTYKKILRKKMKRNADRFPLKARHGGDS